MWKYQSEESTKNYIDYFSLPVMNLKKYLIITSLIIMKKL